ncbi:penicillin-binding transpeptidase domain-containing protein [Halobacteriovorax sp. GB3]|uniref:penicillin-binding transpeptidase domain-containing protein n=1 Tax=Halobacteriovorax sp. GB3 TaxID=2719615 RepID=UPI0023614571|nr:penicillin-binding transpeptidase domain-containing protein [Halobacteriovorax sp. GB3]MDD0854665.1 penicillin-binding transpeptidase domain-containing protein [Halobacteriovorax sp. GB3]
MNKDKKIVHFVFAGFVLAFAVVAGKAFKVQVLDKEKLISRAKRQFFRERKVYPKRGNIYDRNGNPLAINIQTYSLFTIPKNIKNPKAEFKKLARILPDMSYKEILDRVSDRKRFTWLGRKLTLSEEQVTKIKDLNGIYLEAVPKRFYPNHELFAQGLGFVGVDNVGLSGVEYEFDTQLRGEPKIMKYIIDRKGRPVRYESTEIGDRAQDIVLSIDKDIQAIAEKSIKEAVEKAEAFRGGIGVMNAHTGEILAMANYPTFDPNEPGKYPSNTRKLPFVSDPFEPGSTFKIFTVASALENNIAKPETNYYCEKGQLKVEDHIISEAESKKKFEWLSVDEIIRYSSNVGTTKIAFDLKYPKLKKTLKDFKFGDKTNIEIPAESRGIFTDEDNVRPLSLSNISFGQGVATTGIQMLAAYSAIANGGQYIKPTIFKRKPSEVIKKERVVSEKTAKELTKMLINAVEDGTGARAKVPYFTIAGKTSTAQRSDSSGRYNGYIPGFLGYPVGVNNPFVIYVYVDKPARGKIYYGSYVAGPVFKKVAQYILYKNKEFSNLAVNDDYRNSKAFDTVKVKHSSTRIVGQGLVPNFIGLDKKSANRLATKLKIDVNHRGIGVVVDQLPKVGEQIDEHASVKLIYSPPSYE